MPSEPSVFGGPDAGTTEGSGKGCAASEPDLKVLRASEAPWAFETPGVSEVPGVPEVVETPKAPAAPGTPTTPGTPTAHAPLGSLERVALDLVGVVYDIQGFSVQDGPGIRTTVFLKGCPLHCPWCHSPESQRFDIQLSWQSRKCIGLDLCGLCLPVCPRGALSPAQTAAPVPIVTVTEAAHEAAVAADAPEAVDEAALAAPFPRPSLRGSRVLSRSIGRSATIAASALRPAPPVLSRCGGQEHTVGEVVAVSFVTGRSSTNPAAESRSREESLSRRRRSPSPCCRRLRPKMSMSRSTLPGVSLGARLRRLCPTSICFSMI